MQTTWKIVVVTIALLFFSIFLWKRQPSAQEYQRRGAEGALEEEELAPDSQVVTPEDEFTDEHSADEESRDQYPEAEEDFSYRDSENRPSVPPVDDATSSLPEMNPPPDTESAEEPPVATSGPPALPGTDSLLPRERVAVTLVAAGVEAMDKEEGGRARSLFERAIEIAPLQPYSYYFLGKLALTHGEHQRALPLLRKADTLLTRGDLAWRSEAISTQGAVYEDLGELPQARRAYRKSLRLFPQNLRAMSALARLAGEEPDADDTVPQ